MFQSAYYAGEPLITDNNYQRQCGPQVIQGETKLYGRVPRDYAKVPYGALPGAAKFDLPLIPRSEWDDRIEQREKEHALLSEVMLSLNIPSLDQNGTNYCWTNGVVTAMYGVGALANDPFVDLSPASVAAPIKGYRNQGGWGGEALEYIIKNGIAPASLWPANAISKKYDNAETQAARVKTKVTEWYELQSRNFDELMTCLLLGIPVAVGYNWWSHEVCAIDAVSGDTSRKSSDWYGLGSRYGVRIRNSWGSSYGSNGFAVLAENKGTPDDAVAPCVKTLAA